MLPAYWPLLVAGLAFMAVGPIFCVRATAVASWVTGLLQHAPAPVASAFLLRRVPRTAGETVKYLGDIYRVIGVGWTAFGIILLLAVFYAKPG